MSVATVQSTKVDPSVGANIVLVLSGSPTSGNLLLAFINYGQFGTARTVTPPDGSWVQVDTATQTFDSIDVWRRAVVGGDGTSWTFTLNDGAEFCSGEMIEISGHNTSTPINQHATSKNLATSSLATGSVTPSVLSCLGVSGQTQDNSGAAGDSVGTGWTIIQTAASGSGRGGNLATKDSLTSDTTTAISTTWTIPSGPTEALTAIVLVAPAAAGGAAIRSSTLTLTGVQ